VFIRSDNFAASENQGQLRHMLSVDVGGGAASLALAMPLARAIPKIPASCWPIPERNARDPARDASTDQPQEHFVDQPV
jgi:hypothetical protein